MDEIKSMVNGGISFDTPVKVKATPHSPLVIIHGIEKSPAGDIYIRLADGNFKLEETDKNYSMVAASILQRLKLPK